MSDRAAGDRIQAYVLGLKIGAGGFGTVWRASHADTGQIVALKILSGKYASGDSPRIRAEVELLAGAALTSSHVVRVIDGGVEPTPYIVMEYVEGEDLAAELDRRGTIPQPDVLVIARSIAEALKDLERAGIIHRDIKPSNVIRAKDGVIKVADFGIAKILGFDQVTVAGHSPMSLAYAAPEAWEGRTSHATDIYGLGALLFQCLTGRAPFVGSPAEILNQHRSEVPDLDLLPTDTVPALRALIAACLAKSEEQRPPNAEDLLERIALAERQLRERSDASSTSLRPPTRFGPWTRQSVHPTEVRAFRCIDELTGKRATVELHASKTLALGDELQRAVEANAALVPLGAERLLGTSRLMLRPGEGWEENQGKFLFWVARDEQEQATLPAVLNSANLAKAVQRFLILLDTAIAAGLPMTPAETDFAFGSEGLIVRRPGLPPRIEVAGDPGLSLLGFLQSLPVDDTTRRALMAVGDLAALREWVTRVGGAPFGVAREASNSASGTEQRQVESALVSAAAFTPGSRSGSKAPIAAEQAPPKPARRDPGSTGNGEPPVPPPPIDRGRGRGWWMRFGAIAAILLGAAGLALFVFVRSHDDGDGPDVIGPTPQSTSTPKTATPSSTQTVSRSLTPTATSTPTSRTATPADSDPDVLTQIEIPAPGEKIPANSQFTLNVLANVEYRWKFTATVGQLVEFRVDGATTSNIRPGIAVLGSDGHRLFGDYDNSGNGYFRIANRLDSTGDFTVLISGNSGSGEATVRFRLDPYRKILPATPIDTTFGLPGELDRYQFDASPGDLIELRIVRSADTKIKPRYELVDLFDARVAGDYDNADAGYAVWSGFVRKEGRYTIRASAANSATGRYSIELLVNPFIDYTLGQTVQGIISKPVQRDRYRFQCSVGQRMSITVIPAPETKIHPGYEIFDIGSERVGGDYQSADGKPIQGEHVCKFTGLYYVAIRAQGGSERGGYSVLIQ